MTRFAEDLSECPSISASCRPLLDDMRRGDDRGAELSELCSGS